MPTTTHPFSFRGQTRQIVRHPGVISRHKRGTLTDEALGRAPWYLRLSFGGRDILRSLGTHSTTEAVRRARARLAAQADRDDFADLLDATKRRATLTLETLAADWVALRCPHAGGAVRTPAQITHLHPFLRGALTWWGTRCPVTIRPRDLQDFAAHKRQHAPPGATGERAADLELATLSSLCQWAMAAERIDRNPFAGRPRFRRPEAVVHCHAHMPDSDDELHRILGWLFSSPVHERVVAGAHLAICALTGLRPGEPGALLAQPPPPGNRPQPGTRYTIQLDGRTIEKLAVGRTKSGQNCAVVVHPALADFLDHWRRWLAVHCPGATYLLPDPAAPTRPLVPFGEANASRLRNDLVAACAALGLPERHAHSMRAFYVRVRRAAGADDLTISVELGQGSGAGLIRRTYGDARDIQGDGRFDWLPDPPAVPAWRTLTLTEASNLLPMAAG